MFANPSKNMRILLRPKHGFTLTELAIVLGVIGTILGAVWEASSQVNAGKNVQKATSQIIQILNGYRTLYSMHGVDVASTDVTCIGVMNGYFPSEMVSSTTCTGATPTSPQDPWGGNVSVVADQATNTIQITYQDLPQSACIGVINGIDSPDEVMQYIEQVGAGWVNTNILPPLGTGTAYTAVQLANLCNAAGNTNSILVGFLAH